MGKGVELLVEKVVAH